jgi:zinc protease
VKRNIAVLLLVWSLLIPVAATAAGPQGQSVSKPRSASGAPAQVKSTQLVSKVLANGLEIIVLEDHSIPLVTVELAVKNGSYTEPPELNGLSHLYEHMFFKANKATLDRADYLQTIGQLGIVYNGSTREEIVNYYFSTTTPNMRTAMRLLSDSARYPLFDPQQFEQERQAVIGEMDRNESNPYYYLEQALNNKLFYKYTSRKSPLGNRQTVTTATTDMMRLIQSRYYVPNNSALVVTGDAKPEDVFQMAQELFGDWPRADDPFKKFPIVEHPSLPKSEGVIIKQPVNNVVVELGWQGPSVGKDDASTYAADVFSFILMQPGSKFQRDLVDSGLASGLMINYYTQKNVGPIRILAQTTPEKAKAAVDAIYKEISHFNDKDYFTDEQLESAKALLEAEDLYSREKLSEYIHSISFWWGSTGLDYFRGYQGNLRRTSRADISRYVTTYIQGKPHLGLAIMSDQSEKVSKLTSEDLVGKGTERQEAAAAGNRR